VTQYEAESANFAAAVHLATQPGYLGNPTVVNEILVNLWNTTFTRWNSGLVDADAWIKADIERCEQMALIFLGADETFVPMPGWNRPGIIDQFLALRLQIDESNPTIRLAYILLEFLREMWAAVSASRKDPNDAEIFNRLSHIAIEKYRYLLMGVLQPPAGLRSNC